MNEPPYVRIRLKLRWHSERLLKAAVCARQKVRQRDERVDALKRARKQDVYAIIEKVCAKLYRVLAALGRDVVRKFVEINVARKRRKSRSAEARNACDVDRRADLIVYRRFEPAARILKARFVQRPRGKRCHVIDGNRLIAVINIGSATDRVQPSDRARVDRGNVVDAVARRQVVEYSACDRLSQRSSSHQTPKAPAPFRCAAWIVDLVKPIVDGRNVGRRDGDDERIIAARLLEIREQESAITDNRPARLKPYCACVKLSLRGASGFLASKR